MSKFQFTDVPAPSDIAKRVIDRGDPELILLTVAAWLVVHEAIEELSRVDLPGGLVEGLAAHHSEYLNNAGAALAGIVTVLGPDRRDLVMQVVNHVFAFGYRKGFAASAESEPMPTSFAGGGRHE